MGNRISISFLKKGEESVALYSHWDGKELKKTAERYVMELKKEIENNEKTNGVTPLERLEPATVMVDFMRWMSMKEWKEKRITGNYYLEQTGSDGDNSDNGHFKINLETVCP